MWNEAPSTYITSSSTTFRALWFSFDRETCPFLLYLPAFFFFLTLHSIWDWNWDFFFCHLLIFEYDKWGTRPFLGTQWLSLLSLPFSPCLFFLETGPCRIAARRFCKSSVHFSWALSANWIGHGIHGIHGMAWHRLPHLIHFDLHLFLSPLLPFSFGYCFSCFGTLGILDHLHWGLGTSFLFVKGPRHAPGAACVDTW